MGNRAGGVVERRRMVAAEKFWKGVWGELFTKSSPHGPTQPTEKEATKMQVKNGVIAVAAAVAGVLGGWDMALRVLVGFMAADYGTGLVVGLCGRSPKTGGGRLSSRAGFLGLARKGGILLLVLLATLLDRVTGSGFIRTAVCFFFIANEGLSILENLGLMGVRYPRFLREMLEVMGEDADKGKGA